jgi:cell division protein YceG involved in septum cleavage
LARDRTSETSGERTERERVRAREERERRRLAKQGTAVPLPPPEPLASSEPLPPVEVAPPLAIDPPERPHRLHRPHLHRPHVSPVRTGAARVGALLALVVVLAALVGGVVLLVRHAQRRKTPPAPGIVKVVFPEGYTRVQMAALAHADGLRGSYLEASKSSAELRPSIYGASTHPPAGTPNLEGFLFPATYEMYAGAPVSRLVSEQLAAFRENFGGAEVHRAKVLGVTPYQLLIVASIIEREAAIPHDRPLVAAVIYNRLRQNMSLGVDSTLRYALHDFTHPLTEAELSSDSPYNTRIHKGLPPTPISNPGVAAIKAAARPAGVSYLYYVAGADGCGEQVFSTSYAQFERNAAAYREALSKNGGRVPTCKKGR